MSLDIFRYQFTNNPVYRSYCQRLRKSPSEVSCCADIPFLPITFFKSKKVMVSEKDVEIVFESSGTTGSVTSRHYVSNVEIYHKSFTKAFTHFFGPMEDYCILALLPAYLEREGSSLVYMVNDMVKRSKHPDSGFYLYNFDELQSKLVQLEKNETKTLLIGVSFALLDMAEKYPTQLRYTQIMETGGMKGKRKELIREALHAQLKNAFDVSEIYSEYGMTELLSQAYSLGNGIFACPPWMKVATRDTEDPLSGQEYGKTGGINIIDLANIDSCSFIATQDLGKVYEDGTFEILGRFDHSDIRGCNLMAL